MPKNLPKQIEKQLTHLEKLLTKIAEAQAINADDPDTWDSDTLYNLVVNLKETLKLLEDQVIPGKYTEFGQPLTEAGLCSLIDTYHEKDD